MVPFGALVLAGGASRRMGRDKAWLEFEGRPLLLHVIDRLDPVCARIVVAARPGQSLPELPPGVDRVDDPVALGGPLIGVLQGLEVLAEEGVERAQLSSCDAVMLTPEHVRFMFARLAAVPGADALVPVDKWGPHPLSAVVRVEPALARARAMVAEGRQRLVDWVASWPTIDASELPDPRVLLPCNDPEQWERIIDSSSGRS